MNNTIIVVVFIIVSLTFTVIPKSYAYSGLDSICLFIAENDKNRLRKLLKTNRVKIRKLYPDMRCNDKSLLQFAIEKQAKEVGMFIVKKIPASLLKKKGDLKWAEDNGYADSEITTALRERIGG
ncbi:MAG: DUF3718 domain-containing protein [Colwellia sp.]|nr:DUF3718 domain-containing protein [Colwellia sp.]